jgi:hypothetical protein
MSFSADEMAFYGLFICAIRTEIRAGICRNLREIPNLES